MSELRRCSFALLSGVAALLFAPVVSAQSGDELKEQGRFQYERGVDLFRQGDFQGARAAFEESYQYTPYPIVLFNLGLTQAKQSDPVAASETLEKLLAAPGSLSQERLASAKQVLSEQAGRVGTLTVSCDVDGAEVWVDGKNRGTTPMPAPLRVEAKAVQLAFEKQGYSGGLQRASVPAGGNARVSCGLEAPELGTGWISVRTTVPNAEVIIDGRAVGKTPLDRSVAVEVGTRTVELRREGYRVARKSVNLSKGDAVDVELPLVVDEQAPPTTKGVLVLRPSQEQSEVTVDGTSRGFIQGPLALPAGPHVVTVEAGNFRPHTREVLVPAGGQLVLPVELEPTPEYRADYKSSASTVRTLSWIALGGGVLVAGASGVFLAVNEGTVSDAEAAVTEMGTGTVELGEGSAKVTCTDLVDERCKQEFDRRENDLNSARDRRIPAIIGLAVGGLFLGGGVLGMILGDDPGLFDPPELDEQFQARGPRFRPVLSVDEDGAFAGTKVTF